MSKDIYDGLDKTDPHTVFGVHGFELWKTGGNCEAFGANQDITSMGSHYILVTAAEDGGYLPEGMDEKLYVGIYDSVEGDEVAHANDLVGIDAVMAWLKEQIEKIEANDA